MRKRKVNAKKRIAPPAEGIALATLAEQATRAIYTGNPLHKRNRGDFALHPPAMARPGKTLCDGAEIFDRKTAIRMLRKGIEQGLISEQLRAGWPQNVWAVAPNGVALEAMLEDAATGAYHGYPMQSDDPLASEVLRRWNRDD